MKVHQFRCWPSQFDETGKIDRTGYSNITKEVVFGEENVLEGYQNISQIGIQGAPGTRFWLNNAKLSSNPDVLRGIVLNWTGIFEIDLSTVGGEINSLVFDSSSIDYYDKNENSKLIIDILYGGVM